MERKHLWMATAICGLTICTAIVGITAVNRYRSATQPASANGSALYQTQIDPGALPAGAGNSDRHGSAPGGMFFPPDNTDPAPTAAPPLLTVTPNPAPANDPLADYLFSGFATIDGEAVAILEQRSTKQSWYLKPGDTWQNDRVVSINSGQIILTVDGQQRSLAMNDNFNAVPLSADAPFRTQRKQRSGNYLVAFSPDGSSVLSTLDGDLDIILANGQQQFDSYIALDDTNRAGNGGVSWLLPASEVTNTAAITNFTAAFNSSDSTLSFSLDTASVQPQTDEQLQAAQQAEMNARLAEARLLLLKNAIQNAANEAQVTPPDIDEY